MPGRATEKPGKMIVYQLLPRLFGNQNPHPVPNGPIEQNGCGKLEDISQKALQSIKELGVTHIWLTGIIRHATTTAYPKQGLEASHPQVVKGKAGSPYAVTDFFDLDPDLAQNPARRFEELDACIQRIHHAGMQVVVDFIPNHTARVYRSAGGKKLGSDLGEGDDTDTCFHPQNHYYYLPGQALQLPGNEAEKTTNPFEEYPAKATGNDCFSATPSTTDWYETVKLNYGTDYRSGHSYFDPMPRTWLYMLEVLRFWASKKVDAFRCDMVEMVPVAFWAWAIPKIKEEFPHILFIAEVYNPDLYLPYLNEGGFDYLYDKVEMYDALRALAEQKGDANQLTRIWQRQEGMSHRMLRFLENHDEQRIASPLVGKTAANTLSALAAMACMHTGPLMLYFGQELGEQASGTAGFSGDDGKTTIFDYWHVPTIQQWQNSGEWNDNNLTTDQKQWRNAHVEILRFAAENPAIVSGGFYDLQYANQDNAYYKSNIMYSFFRFTAEHKVLVVCSFSANTESVRLILPEDAWHNIGFTPHGPFGLTHAFDPKQNLTCFARATYDADGGTAGLVFSILPFGYHVWHLTPID